MLFFDVREGVPSLVVWCAREQTQQNARKEGDQLLHDWGIREDEGPLKASAINHYSDNQRECLKSRFAAVAFCFLFYSAALWGFPRTFFFLTF